MNMSKHRYLVLAVFSYMQMLNAVSIYLTTSLPPIAVTSVKPSTLLLPQGFDSQLPPRQPMLYPFVVSTTATPTPTTSTKQSLGPFITPGWIPIASSSNVNNYKEMLTLSPSATTFPTTAAPPQPYPVPVLEDRVSKYVLTSNDNGPVFESIVYGTWKPDPPLQPVEMLNATTTMYSSDNSVISSSSRSTTKSVSDISDSTSSHDSSVVDGKVSNKTINRQHGGFIDNKQQKIIAFEHQSPPRDSHELAVLIQRPNESTTQDNSDEPKQRKFVKKQGRQKIRPNLTTKMTKTTFEITTTPIASTEQSATESGTATNSDVAQLNINVPVEVVRQINDSIEIKYNHKQTSRHSIEVTAHEHYSNHRLDDHYGDLNDHDETEIVTAPTTSADLQQQENADVDEDEDEGDDDDDDGGSSVIRMNWPTDFMNTPLISSTSVEPPSGVADSSQLTTSKSTEPESAELPLALSSLNIPPSLWPKFPGNITKLGAPYTAESSLEEPALCVPITVREHNMMNSHETVNIERVFCFPMPSTKLPRAFSKPTASSTMKSGIVRGRSSTTNPVIKANVQNYEDFYELNSRNNASYVLKSHLSLVCYVLVVYFKYMY